MSKRIITGVISAIALILLVIFRGWLFKLTILAVLLIAIGEFYNTFTAGNMKMYRFPSYFYVVLLLPAWHALGISGVAALFIISMMLAMSYVIFQRERKLEDMYTTLFPLYYSLLPISLLLFFISIENAVLSSMMLLVIFEMSALGDTFAFFVGSKWGKTMLIPMLSPKKTVEGAIAGIIGGSAAVIITAWIFKMHLGAAMPPIWHFAILAPIGCFAGEIGDLTASLLKRHCGVKDFGTLFPGHGGVLDRLDSIHFTIAITFAYCLITGMV